MPTLKARIERLEQTVGLRPEYVIETPRQYYATQQRFRCPYRNLRPPPESGELEPLPPPDPSLPIEERFTYGEAVRAGIIIETPALVTAMNQLPCRERGPCYCKCSYCGLSRWENNNSGPCKIPWVPTLRAG